MVPLFRAVFWMLSANSLMSIQPDFDPIFRRVLTVPAKSKNTNAVKILRRVFRGRPARGCRQIATEQYDFHSRKARMLPCSRCLLLSFCVERLAFGVWPCAAAAPRQDALLNSQRACGGPDFKRQTLNTKRLNEAPLTGRHSGTLTV